MFLHYFSVFGIVRNSHCSAQVNSVSVMFHLVCKTTILFCRLKARHCAFFAHCPINESCTSQERMQKGITILMTKNTNEKGATSIFSVLNIRGVL